MGCFAEGAYWKILKPGEDAVKEPLNPSFKQARAPTVEEQDAKFVPVKYSFSNYVFNIPKFIAVVKEDKC